MSCLYNYLLVIDPGGKVHFFTALSRKFETKHVKNEPSQPNFLLQTKMEPKITRLFCVFDDAILNLTH